MSEASDEPDRETRRRIAGGDEQALAELFGRFRSRLWRVVNFRLDPQLIGRIDADDVLQETWLNAVKRISAFPRDEDLSAFVWFRLIVQQTMIDVRRRHLGAQRRSASREAAPSKWSAESTSFSLSSQLAGTMTSPSEAMMREEAARQLRAQLDQMSALDREVLALRHFEELSNKEAAEVLGLSEQAASVRYVRALKRLQKILMGIPPERESED